MDQVDEDNDTILIFSMTFKHDDDQNFHNDHHHHPSVATNVQCQLVKQEGHDHDFNDDKIIYMIITTIHWHPRAVPVDKSKKIQLSLHQLLMSVWG